MPDGRVEAFPQIAEVPDLERGAKAPGLARVQDYLNRFGYLPRGSYEKGALDEATSEALALYQERNAVPATGELDTSTKDAMTTGRCAMPDLDDGVAFTARCAWNKSNLTFAFGNGTRDVAGNAEFDAVRRAFDTWQAAAPLTFTEVQAADGPDILIDWRDSSDPDHSMVGGVLAHADYPPGCGVVTNTLPKPLHFDDTEHTWADRAAPDAFDVETVALHEIGHILGLQHSTVNGAVMFPSVSSDFTLRVLQADDLAGIRQLYPAAPAVPAA